MNKQKLKHLNFNLKQDPESSRFFICSAFEIYYKYLIENNRIITFEFLNIGSYFISEYLDILSQRLENIETLNVENQINILKLEVEKHPYLTKMDKNRFYKFLDRVVKNLVL